MATAKELAAWIVQNQDKQGTPEFQTVAQAYQAVRQREQGAPAAGEPDMRAGRGTNRNRQAEAAPSSPPTQERGIKERLASFLYGATYEPVLGLEQLNQRMQSPNPIFNIPRLAQAGVAALTGETPTSPTERAAAIEQSLGVSPGEIDFFRLGGNIVNPLNLYMGRGLVGGSVTQKAGTGSVMGAAAAGATPLTEDESFVEDKLFNAGFGAIIGGSIPLTIEAGKGIVRTIKNLPISAANKRAALQKFVVDLAGDDPDKVAKILQEAEDLVPGSRTTAADALADTPEAIRLVKEQERLAALPEQGSRFATLRQEREAARMAELDRTFGTPEDIAQLQRERSEVTAPLREQALEQANIYGQTAPRLEAELAARQQSAIGALQGQGRTATEAAQAVNRANTWSPVPGQPRFPGRYSPNMERAVEFKQTADEFGSVVDQRKAEAAFKQMQLNSLKNEGFYPLETQPLLQQIQKSLQTPGQRSNELLVTTQQRLAEKLSRLSDENGIINSQDLYNIRKQIADDIAEQLNTKTGNPSFTTEAANVETALKKQLDAAISKASGSGAWEDYLTNYSKYSQKIDQMRVGQELKARLGEGSIGDAEKAGVFATAINNSASVVRRATGVSRYNKLEEVLNKDQLASVNRVFADLSRTKKAENLAKQIKLDNPELLAGAENSPQFLNQYVTAFKGLMERLRRGSQREFDNEMSKLMADPKALGLFIESIPKKDIPNLTQAMMAKMSPEMAANFQVILSGGAVPRALSMEAARE